MKKIFKIKSLIRVVALTLVLLFSLQSSGCLLETVLGAAFIGGLTAAKQTSSANTTVKDVYPDIEPEKSGPEQATEKTPVPTATPVPAETANPSDTTDKAGDTSGPVTAQDGELFSRKPQNRPEIKFSEIEYEEPDFDTLENNLNALFKDIQASDGSNVDGLIDRFDELLEVYNKANSMSSYAYIRYSQNVNDSVWQQRSNDLELKLTELDLIMTDCAIALMEMGPQARQRWGDDFCDCVIAGESLNDESVQDLFKEEEDLVDEYEVLITSYEFTFNGKKCTADDLNTIYEEQGYDTYEKAYNAYSAGLNQQAGEIYLKLISIRNEIAVRLGFDNYAEYQYECYSRDYTVKDTQLLHAYVKQYIPSVYYLSVALPYYIDLYDGSDETIAFDDFLPKFREALSDISPALTEALDYYLTYETYDMTPDDNKMESSYSTIIDSYSMPFIFMQWEDDQRSAQTLTHEFGHYSNFYFNPSAGWSVTDPLDLSEIDSQGMEMLMMEYYESFYGRGADSARIDQLSDALYALLTGCMEDEFQQYAYSHPDCTLDELNEYYYQLAQEYGLSDLYPYTGTEWVQIPHSFSSPMYYISYATSVIPALQIWELSQTDREEAVEAYLNIMDREAYPTFRDTVTSAGLADPFAERTIKGIATSVSQYLYSFAG